MKTIENKSSNDIDLMRRLNDKNRKYQRVKRTSNSHRNKKGVRKAHSLNPLRNARHLNARLNSRSKSRSKSKSNKSRNPRINSKKSMKQLNPPKSRSLKSPMVGSNSRSGGSKKSKSSKSKSISNSRSNLAD